MPFKFRYKTILKYREDQEKRAKNDLAIANMALNQAKNALNTALQHQNEYFKQRDAAILKGLSASEFQKYNMGKIYHERQIETIKVQIEKCKEEIEQFRQIMIDATQEKKKMERLKEQALKIYREKEIQEENIVVDNLVTYKTSKKVDGELHEK